jgi:hypothetical protein
MAPNPRFAHNPATAPCGRGSGRCDARHRAATAKERLQVRRPLQSRDCEGAVASCSIRRPPVRLPARSTVRASCNIRPSELLKSARHCGFIARIASPRPAGSCKACRASSAGVTKLCPRRLPITSQHTTGRYGTSGRGTLACHLQPALTVDRCLPRISRAGPIEFRRIE